MADASGARSPASSCCKASYPWSPSVTRSPRSIPRTSSAHKRVCHLLLVVPHPADLCPDLRVEGVLLERRLGSRARPPVGHALDLPFRGPLHDRFSEGKALFPDNALEALAFQVGMHGQDAV